MQVTARPSAPMGPMRRIGTLRVVSTAAELTARGTSFAADQLRIKRMVGQGSFGEVFEVRAWLTGHIFSVYIHVSDYLYF